MTYQEDCTGSVDEKLKVWQQGVFHEPCQMATRRENNWGGIRSPQLVDICLRQQSAHVAFPGQAIYGSRRDVDSAYTRVCCTPLDAVHMIFVFWLYGIRCVAIPLVSTFGNPDSNFQFRVITELIESRAVARTTLWIPGPHSYVFSAMATDDLITFGPHDLVEAELEASGIDIPAAVGDGGVSLSKDLFARVLEVVGFVFDNIHGSVLLSQKGYSSLLDLFWEDSDAIPEVGSLIATDRLQRMASLAIRYALFMPLLLPFSRGFSSCIDADSKQSILSARAILDWALWRIVLRRASDNPAWFEISYTIPILFYQPPTESDSDFALRQAAVADAQVYVDACTRINGLGVYAPSKFTAFLNFPFWHHFLTAQGTLEPVNINLLEFVAAIFGIILYITTVLPPPTPNTHARRKFHLHVWTDNMTTYWTIRKCRSRFPLYNILLQILALAQVHYNVLVTIGHYPGRLNIYSDAVSRQFQVPNALEILAFLQHLPHYRIGNAWTRSIILLALLPSLHPLQSLHSALTGLASISGLCSALRTTNLSMPPAPSR
jgi:hypothetical protein